MFDWIRRIHDMAVYQVWSAIPVHPSGIAPYGPVNQPTSWRYAYLQAKALMKLDFTHFPPGSRLQIKRWIPGEQPGTIVRSWIRHRSGLFGSWRREQ